MEVIICKIFFFYVSVKIWSLIRINDDKGWVIKVEGFMRLPFALFLFIFIFSLSYFQINLLADIYKIHNTFGGSFSFPGM